MKLFEREENGSSVATMEASNLRIKIHKLMKELLQESELESPTDLRDFQVVACDAVDIFVCTEIIQRRKPHEFNSDIATSTKL